MARAARRSTLDQTRLYMRRQASNPLRYVLEQVLTGTLGWVPTPIGLVLRAIGYRAIMRMQGLAAIERGVRLRFADNVHLGHGAYIDERVYLHACPGGIHIGRDTLVMHGSVLHVYNFRDLPQSGIWIGDDSLIGEYNVIRGQGGVRIGHRVYTSPMVQIVAVNHVFDDPSRSFVEQGITALGITIEDDVWVGSGAVITDGVRIGKGAVVAAGSVVTRDVMPGTVVGGSPARLLKHVGDQHVKREQVPVYF